MAAARAANAYEICAVGDVAPGSLRVFQAGAETVLVCNVGGVLHGVRNLCTHAASALDGGTLRNTVLTCPMHGAQFDVRTGRCLSDGSLRPLTRIALEVDGTVVKAMVAE